MRKQALCLLTLTIGCSPSPEPKQPTNPDPPLDTPTKRIEAPPAPSKAADELNKGAAALTAGDLVAAEKNFSDALKKDPASADAHAGLGIIADKKGDRAKAESEYTEALKLNPDLVAASENLSALQIEAGRNEDAVAVAKKALSTHPENAPLQLNLAVASATLGDQVTSIAAFEQAVKRSPNDPIYWLTYGHSLAAFKNADATAKLQKADSLVSSAGVSPKESLGLYASIGHEFRLAGAFAECVATLDKAVAIKDVAELRVDRALCKLGNKAEAEAEADLVEATKKEPNYALAHFYLGGRYARKAKWKECISEYEQYRKLAPTGPLNKQAEDRIKLAKEKQKAGAKK